MPGEQMGRSGSSWDTMYDHHTGLLSAAVSKWPLGFVVSVLRGAPSRCREGAGRSGRLCPHQWGKQWVPGAQRQCFQLWSTMGEQQS